MEQKVGKFFIISKTERNIRIGHKWLFLLFLLLVMIPPLNSQSNDSEQLFRRRIVWSGGEHAFRFAVEIQRAENGSYRNHLYEYTTSHFILVSLPLGEYRFRIIPYDILDRPAEGTSWINFDIQLPGSNNAGLSDVSDDIFDEQVQVISTDNYSELRQLEDSRDRSEILREGIILDQMRTEIDKIETEPLSEILMNNNSDRFNSVGISIGTSFIDPLAVISIHGSYAPLPNMFIELGSDFGFISIYEDVEKFYIFYPFVNLGLFFPFTNSGGFFACIGGGYMVGNYVFTKGTTGINLWGVNFIAGINLRNVLNISYTFTTNFIEAKNKLAIGYVYRFMPMRNSE